MVFVDLLSEPQVAEDAEVFHRLGGIEGAVGVVRQRAGASHDPVIAGRFCREAEQLLTGLDTESAWDAALAAEPGPRQALAAERLDRALAAIAQFADLKSPYTTGHSTGVAALAAAAAMPA